ncbi:MAG TPA: ABC-F family ATP-binding cassette domain-containing protein [Chloroflexota bacterium]|nr:ABC-F family ATP-binding cassette domain-containing protein [Chloroflexota bacterium]
MLRVDSVSKAYAGEPVLIDISFTLAPGARVGLVGPNGSGKSTLLRLIAGDLSPDSGTIWIDPHSEAGYLPQYPVDELRLSVRQSLRRAAGRLGELGAKLDALESRLADSPAGQVESLLDEYAAVQDEFERRGGYALESRMETVLSGLAVDVDLETPISALSGGTKTKLSLARLLLSEANLLLLDEPTNYLDLPALLWLERFVTESDRSYIIVSHDRHFLDATIGSVLELDPTHHTLREWPGTYSDYTAARESERRKQVEAYRDQELAIARIEEDIRRTKEQARRTERGTSNDVLRRYAKKVARKAVVRERRLQREMDRGEQIEKPLPGWGLHLVDLNRDPIGDNRLVVEANDVRAGYGGQEVLHGVSFTLRGRDRVALLGENGSGKTTLLRCITGDMPYTGSVKMGPSIRAGVLSQEQGDLPPSSTVLDVFRSRTEMREDEARTYLHKFLISGDEALKLISALSYGQRAKLALAMLVLCGANFLILDEPTSHMDLPALEAIEEALAAFTGPVLVVSHDRAFLESAGMNRVLLLDHGELTEVDVMSV